jgi:poly(hydroxyalkanoate) depolymerase family esterase
MSIFDRMQLAPSRFLEAWAMAAAQAGAIGRVVETTGFGSNPGRLRMLAYAPPRLRAGRPLVVVLHGCGQDAARFAADAGWLDLARQHGVALVLPEQTSVNNRGLCFNWFRADDVRRGSGEAMSIRQMVRLARERYRSDPRRVFIAGFSAGGGMAAAILAAYPAVFAAGGVVAAMPVGSARTQMQALLRMRRANPLRLRQYLAATVRAAAPPRATRAWPRLSIWQGARDPTVHPGNAETLAAQWSELHGWDAKPSTLDDIGPGIRRQAWGRAARPAVELWTLDEIGHGFPVDPRLAGGGRVGPWVVDAGLSAAQRMAAFWGLGGPGLLRA